MSSATFKPRLELLRVYHSVCIDVDKLANLPEAFD